MDHQHYAWNTLNSPKAAGAMVSKALKVSLFQTHPCGLKPEQTPFHAVKGIFPEEHVKVVNTGCSWALQPGRAQRP